MAIKGTPKRSSIPVKNRLDVSERRNFQNIPTKTNRAEQTKRSDDTFKNLSVGLQDIDEAILYYFQEVIKPLVKENDREIKVPIRYGSPELWKSAQSNGFLTDQKGKIITPIIIYRRNNVSRDDSVPIDKADGNIVHQYPIRWSSKNRYDRFSLLTNDRKPTYEMYNVVVPDYIVIDYECSIWTSYVTQMNKIVEQIYYSEGQFWGDPDKFKFSSRIDSFDQNIDIDTDKGRLVRSNFSIQTRGYLIPEVANDRITTTKTHTNQEIILNEKIVTNLDDK
jgi:hypothetical protein